MARVAIPRRKALVVALACAYLGCTDRSGPAGTDSQGAEGQASEGDPTSGSATGEQPDPAVLETACADYCELEAPCLPEAIPTFYESIEECVAGCIVSLESKYRDDCGPESLARLVCWADLTCEQLTEFSKTGYSSCGDNGDPLCVGDE